jgi:hypothetical protein
MSFTRVESKEECGTAHGTYGMADSGNWGDGRYETLFVEGSDIADVWTLTAKMIGQTTIRLQTPYRLLIAIMAIKGGLVPNPSQKGDIVAIIKAIDADSCFNGSHYAAEIWMLKDRTFCVRIGGSRTSDDIWLKKEVKEQKQTLAVWN